MKQLLCCFVVGVALFWWATRPFPIFATARLAILGFLAFVILWLLFSAGVRADALIVASVLLGGLLLGTLLSPAWRTSLESAFVPAVAVVLFLLVASAGMQRSWLIVAMVGAASMLAMVSLVDFLEEVVFWHRVIADVAPSSSFWDRLPVTLPRVGVGGLHPNETAMVAAMSIPMALIGHRRFPEFRVFWSVAVMALGMMLLVTGSRGGIIAGVIATALTAWALRRRNPRSQRRGAKASIAIAVVTLVGVCVVLFTDYRPAFIFRGTAGDRLPLWSAGWEMFLDQPIIGNGAGSFSWLVDEYLGSTYPGVEARRIWTEAHNGYIQLLAEAGLLGAGAVASALWLVLRRARILMRRGSNDRIYAAAVMAGIAGLAFHSLFDALTAGLAPLIFVSALVGGLFVEPSDVERPNVWSSRVWALSLVAPLALFAAVTIGPHFTYERGVADAHAGRWSQALEHFDRAAASDSLPLYERAASVAEAWAGTLDPQRIRYVSGLEPFDSAAFLNRVFMAEPESRTLLLDHAAGQLRHEEVIQVSVGEMRASAGNHALALDSYVAALDANPWLVGSEIWPAALSTSDGRQEMYDATMEIDPCGNGDVFHVEGIDLRGFVEQIEQSCPTDHPTNLALQLAQGNVDFVQREAIEGLESVPENTRLRRLAALSSADIEAAHRHFAVAGLLGDSWSAMELARTYEPAGLPRSVADLLRRNVLAYSPLVLSGDVEIYRYAAIHSRVVSRRPGIPATLIDGRWRLAATNVHREILEMLDSDG